MTDIAKLGFEADTSGLGKAKSALDDLANTGKKVDSALDGVANAAAGAGKAIDAAGDRARQTGQEMRGADREVRSAISGFERMERNIGRVAGAFSTLRNAVIAYGAVRIGQSLIETSVAFQRMETTLNFATGSMEGARREIAFVRAESERLGQDFLTAGRAYSKLSASASALGLTNEEVRKVFSSTSAAAVTMGLSAYEAEGAFLALQQMLAKGTVQAEELRGQLGERIPTAFADAAAALGMTTKQLSKALEQGQVESKQFVLALSNYWQEKFGSAIPNASQNANIAITDLGNAVIDLKKSVADGFLADFSYAMQEMAKAISDPAALANARGIGEALGDLITLMVNNSETILRVLGALSGFALLKYFGPKGMVAGLALGAFTPELLEIIKTWSEDTRTSRQMLEYELERLEETIEKKTKAFAGRGAGKELSDAEQKALNATMAPLLARKAQLERELSTIDELQALSTEYDSVVQAIDRLKKTTTAAATEEKTYSKEQENALAKLERTAAMLDLTSRQRKIANALISTGAADLKVAVKIAEGEIKSLDDRQKKTIALVEAELDHAAATERRAEATERATEATRGEEARMLAAERLWKERADRSLEIVANVEREIIANDRLTEVTLEGDHAVRVFIRSQALLKEGFQGSEQAARDMAEAIIASEDRLSLTRDSMDELERFATRAFDRIGEAITQAFATGKLEAIDFGAVTKAVISEVVQEFLLLGAINPLKNAAFGRNLPTLASVAAAAGGGNGGGGFSFGSIPNPFSLFSNGFGNIGSNFAGGGVSSVLFGLPATGAAGAGVAPVAGGLTNVGAFGGSSGLFGAGGAASLAGVLGIVAALGAAALLASQLFKKSSSGPASSATFGLDAGRVGDYAVGVDNKGDSEIGRQIGEAVKGVLNPLADRFGLAYQTGFLSGAVGFVNGAYRSSIENVALSPKGNTTRSTLGIPGVDDDLREFGDNRAAATADYITRSLLQGVLDGTIKGIDENVKPTLVTAFRNLAAGIDKSFSESDFEALQRRINLAFRFDDIVDAMRLTGENADALTRKIKQQRLAYAEAAAAAPSAIKPIVEFLKDAAELFGGPGSTTRRAINDAANVGTPGDFGLESAIGTSGQTLPQVTLATGLDDDSRFFRFGKGVTGIYAQRPDDNRNPASQITFSDPSLSPGNAVTYADEDTRGPQGLGFAGFQIGGVNIRSIADEGSGTWSYLVEGANEVIQAYTRLNQNGVKTLVVDTEVLIGALKRAGLNMTEIATELGDEEMLSRIRAAGEAANGMVRDVIADLALVEGESGLTGFAAIFEEQKAKIEALRPALDELNGKFAELGIATIDISETIGTAIETLRTNVQDKFRRTLEDIIDPEGAKLRAIADERSDFTRQADQLYGGAIPADIADLIERAWRKRLEDAGYAVDEFGNVVKAATEAANDNVAAFAAAASNFAQAITRVEGDVNRYRSLESQYRTARAGFAGDPNISALSPADQLNRTRDAFEDAYVRATEGSDADRAQAEAEIIGLSRAYLEASRRYYGSSLEHQAVFDDVDGKLAGLQDRAATQLQVAIEQLSVLQDIRDRLGAAGGERNFGANPIRNKTLAALFPEFTSDFGAGAFNTFFQGRIAANDNRVSLAEQIISAIGFAGGGVMTASGPMPLRRYAAGGVANSPQVAIFGEGRLPEAYVPLEDGRSIPVTIRGGGFGDIDTAAVERRLDVIATILSRGFDRLDARLAEVASSFDRAGRDARKEAARPRRAA